MLATTPNTLNQRNQPSAGKPREESKSRRSQAGEVTKAGKRLEKSSTRREQTREQKFLKTGPKSGQGEKMMLSRKRQQTPKREPGPKE